MLSQPLLVIVLFRRSNTRLEETFPGMTRVEPPAQLPGTLTMRAWAADAGPLQSRLPDGNAPEWQLVQPLATTACEKKSEKREAVTVTLRVGLSSDCRPPPGASVLTRRIT